MRILHVSDLHGTMPKIVDDSWDVMVNTGDWQPTKGRRAGDDKIRPRAEWLYQEQWVRRNLVQIAEWLRGRPMIFVPGNHDYYNPVPMLRTVGIDAIDANLTLVELGGLRFYGVPHIPFHPKFDLFPEWNRQVPEAEIAEIMKAVPRDIDVFLAHCPPAGILDQHGKRRFGSSAILHAFEHEWEADFPRLYLCGHIHASYGVHQWYEMHVSNAATGGRMIEINPRGGKSVENTGQPEASPLRPRPGKGTLPT